jgi:type VI protein secretion system component Hcp
MAKKSNAKLHKGKKLEEQKPLKSAHGGFSITKPVDSSTPK